MRRTWFLVAVLVAAGCGGYAGGHHDPGPAGDSPALSADGIGIDLPDGWTGRILIGASGRPVLHAATFPVEANDTDDGMIAKEAIGINGMYLNVRDLGPGNADASVPLSLHAADFGMPEGLCCHLRQATIVLASGGERFRVVAVSGGDADPAQRDLDQLNEALSSLQLSAYQAPPLEAATGNPIDGFGLHANVPAGWNGGVARGEVHAGDDSLDVTISEYSSPDAAAFVTGHVPIRIGPAEFVQPPGGTGYETGRSFVEAGREFQLWVRSPDDAPPPASLERVNAFLASFRAEPGDFYPGTVDPATFTPAEGWSTGTSGAAQIQPEGQSTTTWASTIPYRDDALQFPPSKTVAALPPDGIVVLVTLEQYGQPSGDVTIPPLADFVQGGFEGLGAENAPRHFDALLSHYSAGLWVLFGREHPTQEQLDRAQAELDRLELPDWPAWSISGAR
jgi:hypothetical protein